MKRAELAAACLLDLVLGDPPAIPHPVRAMGAVIAAVDARRVPAAKHLEIALGASLVLALVAVSAVSAHRAVRWGAAARVVLAASTLAARSLIDAVARVGAALETGDLGAARRALRDIVGRDVEGLDEPEIARAALEALAESLGDGVAAPLLALRFGGPPAAMAFKAVSTLDSMIGHREPPYTWFGLVAARADDVANLLPSRAAALAIAVSALVTGDDAAAALRTACADAARHASPNAGWPEAALAGALGVRLGGTNRYDGIAVPGGCFNERGARPTVRDLRRGLRLVSVAIVVLELAAVGSNPR